MTKQGRNWCFTEFTYTEEARQLFVDYFRQGFCRYLVIGREVCPTTDRQHFQGFIVMKNVASLAKMKKISGTAHWTMCNGTAKENNIYCTKEGDFEEWGTMPMDRAEKALKDKEKWLDVIRCAKEGSCEQFYPGEYVRYYSTIRKMYVPDLPAFSPYSGIWFWGVTGSGKSRKAREEYPNLYVKQKNKWWDSYAYEENVLIDDMTPRHSHLGDYMLNWVDHYPFPGEFKGGSSVFRPKNIIVTSNYKIHEVFAELGEETVRALKRRFQEICVQAQPEYDEIDLLVMQAEDMQSRPIGSPNTFVSSEADEEHALGLPGYEDF